MTEEQKLQLIMAEAVSPDDRTPEQAALVSAYEATQAGIAEVKVSLNGMGNQNAREQFKSGIFLRALKSPAFIELLGEFAPTPEEIAEWQGAHDKIENAPAEVKAAILGTVE